MSAQGSRTCGKPAGVKISLAFADKEAMGRKLTITITVDPEAKEISVRDDSGTERSVQAVVVFGGDAEQGVLYLFGYGASADAAWAYRQGLLHAMETDDPYYKNFYKQCACQIAQALDPRAFRQETDPWTVLDRWKGEDPGRGPWN